jgi:beta-lactamase regulating signal transducer with metallopeptidase domain/tetratricopeptide (TPR) repeat protein
LHELVGGWLQHAALTALFFDAWIKSLAVLAVAGGLCFVLRRAAAATRHLIWFLALVSLPCLLLLSAVPHAWQRPLWSVSTGFGSGNEFSLALNLAPTREAPKLAPAGSSEGTAPAAGGEDHAGSRQPIAAHFSATFLVFGILVWLAGILVGLLSVLAGQVQLRRLARNAQSVEAADWALLLREACDQLRLRRPVRLLQSADNPMPLTWGWWRPVVLLPADATNWPNERRRVVLLHELAHAKRWDCLTQAVARFVCALYWINPLVWLAARRMRVERERACDDLVLNSGCRASDYATHLVDIARTFRRTPQLAGIAMARSSQLQGRIAAIVDASRVRQLRPLTALAIIVLIGALGLFVDACSPGASRKQPEDSALRQQQIAWLQSFAQAKEKQSRELAVKAGEQISPEFQSFFAAAIKGDWRTVTNRYAYYKQHHPQYNNGTNEIHADLRTAFWQPVLELCLAYDHVVNCEPKYTALFADGINKSITAGSIYFGGTDPGRGVPTAFCKSHADGDPFFTLTQNALADNSYLDYLRAMYGGRIYTPTAQDSQHCFQEYLAGAQRRLQENKLRLGEDVRMEDNRIQVSGQVAVMSINGLLTKVIFDRNTNQEFYVQESFPLDWMYPYLEPHGLIMKINRQPLAQLPAETLAQDHEYWRKVVAGMLGDWLDEKTTVREVAEFVDRVYVRKNLKGFTGDPRFVRNHYAKASFSKLRSDIAGLYVWRLSGETPPEYRPKSDADQQHLSKKADLAFRQAFALCPDSPEALFRYVQLLLQLNRMDDAVLIAQASLKLDPQNKQAQGLLENIKSYRKQSAGTAKPEASLQQMEDSVRNNPTNLQAALDLANAYQQAHQASRAVEVLDETVSKPGADTSVLLKVAQQYAQMGNTAELESTLERLVKMPAAGPEAWYDLAALKASLSKSSEALAALKQALELSAARLKRDPKARDLLQDARKDARFDKLRNTPAFEKLVPSDNAKDFNNLSTSLKRLVGTRVLTAAEAEALAIELANEKAQALYNCQPFRKGAPAELVQGRWVWNDLRGRGSLDVEATVKFAADGTNPEVDVMLLDSGTRLR